MKENFQPNIAKIVARRIDQLRTDSGMSKRHNIRIIDNKKIVGIFSGDDNISCEFQKFFVLDIVFFECHAHVVLQSERLSVHRVIQNFAVLGIGCDFCVHAERIIKVQKLTVSPLQSFRKV